MTGKKENDWNREAIKDYKVAVYNLIVSVVKEMKKIVRHKENRK